MSYFTQVSQALLRYVFRVSTKSGIWSIQKSVENVSQVTQTDRPLKDSLQVLLYPACTRNLEDGLHCTVEDTLSGSYLQYD